MVDFAGELRQLWVAHRMHHETHQAHRERSKYAFFLDFCSKLTIFKNIFENSSKKDIK